MHIGKAHSNKAPRLTKSMDIDIWEVVTSNELFMKDTSTKTKFSGKLISYWKNSVLCER